MLHFGDQLFEAVGLAGEIDGAAALGVERGFAVALLLLPLADQRGHALAFILDRVGLGAELVALVGDAPCAHAEAR